MNRKWSLLPLFTLLMASCSQPAVLISSEEMLESGYGSYKTYAFIPTTDTMYGKMINRAVFVPALVKEATMLLEKKGFKLDTLHPDVLFTYHLVIARNYDANSEQKVVYNQQVTAASAMPTSMYGYGYGTGAYPGVTIGGGSGGVYGSTTMRTGTEQGSGYYSFSSDNRPYSYQGKINIDTLREGTMVIDMLDAASKRVAWRCVAQGTKKETEKLPPDVAVKTYLPLMFKKMPRK